MRDASDPSRRDPPAAKRLAHAILWPAALSSRTVPIVASCCVALLFVVYGPSLDFQFILDDHRFSSDPRIQESGHLCDYFANYVWAQSTGGPPSFYRPVFALWMRLNFLLSGLSPWGWHLLSITKHALVAVLVGSLAFLLLHDSAAALLAAMLFALHPAQTESVSWVTVPDPLMSALVLGALLCYFRCTEGVRIAPHTSRRRPRKMPAETGSTRQHRWLAASAAAYFAALLAKETAIVFPGVILALDLSVLPSEAKLTDRAKLAKASSRIGSALRHLALFAGTTLLYLLMRFHALGSPLGTATQHLSPSTVMLSWPATLWYYVRVLFWPVRSYSFADPTVIETFSARGVLLPLLGLACASLALLAAWFWAWRKARQLGGPETREAQSALVAGGMLLALPLVPALNLNALNPGDFLHGRYTYLPTAGLMLLVAALWHFARRAKTALLCAAGILVIVFAALTWAQEKQWRDDATVFTVAHQLAPRNAPVARHLADTQVQQALQRIDQGGCGEAMPVFQKVAAAYPDDWYAWAGLAACYVQLNDLLKAEEAMHRAADASHDPRVIQQWQELRAHLGLSTSVPAN